MKFSLDIRWRKRAAQATVVSCLMVLLGQQLVSGIVSDPVTGGPYGASTSTMDTQTKVYLYGNWLRACFVGAGEILSASRIDSYAWFNRNGGNRSLGALALNGTDGSRACDSSNDVKTAVTVLGLDGVAPYDLLCNELGYLTFGLSPSAAKPCNGLSMSSLGVKGTDKIIQPNTSDYSTLYEPIDITSYRLFKPYWGNADQPPLTNAMKYWLFYKTFMIACKPTVTTEPVDAFKQIMDTKVVDASGTISTIRYQFGVGSNIYASTYVAGGDSVNPPPFSNVDFTCVQLAEYFSDDANTSAYATWAIANKTLAEIDQQKLTASFGTTGTNNNTVVEKETCNITGVGWIVCPLAVFIGKTVDAVYTLIEQFMVYDVPDPFGSSPLKTIWGNVLNLANIVFVIAFFVVILSQATSIGISNYGIKKMLPRMIAAAILVNLSYYICIFAVDISNAVGAGLDGLLMSALPDAKKEAIGAIHWQTVIGGAIALSAGIAFAPAIVAAAISFAVPALLAVLTTLVVLIARYALLTILIVLSPLAFVAFILPGTEDLFNKWRKTFVTLLVFYPMVTLLFVGSKVAASIILLQ